jgi:hypothetical protein
MDLSDRLCWHGRSSHGHLDRNVIRFIIALVGLSGKENPMAAGWDKAKADALKILGASGDRDIPMSKSLDVVLQMAMVGAKTYQDDCKQFLQTFSKDCDGQIGPLDNAVEMLIKLKGQIEKDDLGLNSKDKNQLALIKKARLVLSKYADDAIGTIGDASALMRDNKDRLVGSIANKMPRLVGL